MQDVKLIEILQKEVDCWMEIEPEDRGDILVAARAIQRATVEELASEAERNGNDVLAAQLRARVMP